MSIQRNNPDAVYSEGAYSAVVTATGSRQIHVAGTISKNADGEMVGVGDIERQTEQVLENIALVLESEGATLSDVIRRRVFTVDLERFVSDGGIDAMARAWGDTPPASTMLEIARLDDIEVEGIAPGEPTDVDPRYLVEIDATAVVEA